MILVSQNKEKIINFERIAEVIVSDKDICVRDNFEVQKGLIIATYESEERAKEVFQEIVETYEDCNEHSVLAEYAYVKNKVYEMPIN